MSIIKASYMSNAKWQKLFKAVETADIRIVQSNWKYLDNEKVFTHLGLPLQSDLLPDRLKDGAWFPINYKDIEYIEIPSTCKDPKSDAKRLLPDVQQPIKELFEVLEKIGQYPISICNGNLIIRAYEI